MMDPTHPGASGGGFREGIFTPNAEIMCLAHLYENDANITDMSSYYERLHIVEMGNGVCQCDRPNCSFWITVREDVAIQKNIIDIFETMCPTYNQRGLKAYVDQTGGMCANGFIQLPDATDGQKRAALMSVEEGVTIYTYTGEAVDSPCDEEDECICLNVSPDIAIICLWEYWTTNYVIGAQGQI